MILHLEQVSFTYPSNPIFYNLSLEIRAGEFLSILGPNGSGKSTLLKLMSRILEPDAGKIKLQSIPLPRYSRRRLSQLIGYVPQDSSWLFPFSVQEVVLMGRTPHVRSFGFDRENDLDIARESMKRVNILELADKAVTAISGGERQRALIARALAQQPRILLLDEPNAHLDIAHQLEVFEILRNENDERNLTIICVSHDINLASAFSKSILLLAPLGGAMAPLGSIAALGIPSAVLTRSTLSKVFDAPIIVDTHPTAGTPRVSLEVKKQYPLVHGVGK